MTGERGGQRPRVDLHATHGDAVSAAHATGDEVAGEKAAGVGPHARTRAATVTLVAKIVFGVVALLLLVLELVAVKSSLSESPLGVDKAAAVLSVPPPPDLPPNGALVESSVLADGDIQVTEWIRSREPLTTLTLAAPNDQAVAAADVVVGSGDHVVARPRQLVSEPQVVDLLAPTQLVYLRYRLTAAEGSTTAGEDLERAVALAVGYRPHAGPVQVRVSGSAVTGLACVSPGSHVGAREPCGHIEDGAWLLELEGAQRNQTVIADLDLG